MAAEKILTEDDKASGNLVVLPQKQIGRYTVVLHPLCGQLRLSDGRRIQKILAGIPEAE